ncbi:hypothetical protein HOG98_01230 [bacterium]|jgi:hypothetical protein|nr:hypothetical protein [bacterium]
MISAKSKKSISLTLFLFILYIFITPTFSADLSENTRAQIHSISLNDSDSSKQAIISDTSILPKQTSDDGFESEDGYEEGVEPLINEDEDEDPYNSTEANTTSFLDDPKHTSSNSIETNQPYINNLEKFKQLEAEKLAKEIEQKKKLVIYENKVTTLLSDIDGIKEELKAKRLNQTLQLLSNLSSKIKTVQNDYILSFFPDTFSSYSLIVPDTSSEELIPEDSSLFTILYRSSENPNQIIDINIIVSDDSIQEYLHIINHPELVPELVDTKLITLKNGGYKTLEKYRESEQFCERNIVINPELMINIIFYNLESKQDIDNFLDQINIKKLEAYLLE